MILTRRDYGQEKKDAAALAAQTFPPEYQGYSTCVESYYSTPEGSQLLNALAAQGYTPITKINEPNTSLVEAAGGGTKWITLPDGRKQQVAYDGQAFSRAECFSLLSKFV